MKKNKWDTQKNTEAGERLDQRKEGTGKDRKWEEREEEGKWKTTLKYFKISGGMNSH